MLRGIYPDYIWCEICCDGLCSWCKLSESQKSWIFWVIEWSKLERTWWGFSSTLLLKAGSAIRSDQAAEVFVQLGLKYLQEWTPQSPAGQSAPVLGCHKDGFIQKFTSEIFCLKFSQIHFHFPLANYQECSNFLFLLCPPWDFGVWVKSHDNFGNILRIPFCFL